MTSMGAVTFTALIRAKSFRNRRSDDDAEFAKSKSFPEKCHVSIRDNDGLEFRDTRINALQQGNQRQGRTLVRIQAHHHQVLEARMNEILIFNWLYFCFS